MERKKEGNQGQSQEFRLVGAINEDKRSTKINNINVLQLFLTGFHSLKMLYSIFIINVIEDIFLNVQK